VALTSQIRSLADSIISHAAKNLTPFGNGFPNNFSNRAATRIGTSCGWQFTNQATGSAVGRAGNFGTLPDLFALPSAAADSMAAHAQQPHRAKHAEWGCVDKINDRARALSEFDVPLSLRLNRRARGSTLQQPVQYATCASMN